uniref:Uncharacterized protein n=1 Tax=Arundo donax TaxID=35708 RepID=A0A0A9BQ53_ARUDO
MCFKVHSSLSLLSSSTQIASLSSSISSVFAKCNRPWDRSMNPAAVSWKGESSLRGISMILQLFPSTSTAPITHSTAITYCH